MAYCQELIRVNSQSGKGGVAAALERAYGVRLPYEREVEFGRTDDRPRSHIQ